MGLFRVSSNDEAVSEMGLHISMANFAYLETIEDPHIVATYWKRMLGEMKNPLIPFDKFKSFGVLNTLPKENRSVEAMKLIG